MAEQDSKILELAYDAGVSMLKQQEEALTKYRDRALQLLTAATIATSLLGGLSQFSQKSGTGFITRDVAAVVFIAVGALIALNTLITVWKSSKWDAPPGPSLFYCDFYETRKSEQEARVGAVQKMMTIIEDRNAALKPHRIGGRFAAPYCWLTSQLSAPFLPGDGALVIPERSGVGQPRSWCFDLLLRVRGRAGIGVGVRDRPAGPTA